MYPIDNLNTWINAVGSEIRRSPVGSLPHCLQGFSTIPGIPSLITKNHYKHVGDSGDVTPPPRKTNGWNPRTGGLNRCLSLFVCFPGA